MRKHDVDVRRLEDLLVGVECQPRQLALDEVGSILRRREVTVRVYPGVKCRDWAGTCMMVLSLTCLSELCHCGTRWSMCTHEVAFPSSMHCLHASWMLMVVNSGSPVTLSRIRKSRV